MQIFATSPSPVESARYLWETSPVRARKMITESQQILACALVRKGLEQSLIRVDCGCIRTPTSMLRHPIVIWASIDTNNFMWVVRHLKALYSMYKKRGGEKFTNVEGNLKKLTGMFEFEQPDKFLNFAKADSKGLDFTHVADVHAAYRAFLEAQR